MLKPAKDAGIIVLDARNFAKHARSIAPHAPRNAINAECAPNAPVTMTLAENVNRTLAASP